MIVSLKSICLALSLGLAAAVLPAPAQDNSTDSPDATESSAPSEQSRGRGGRRGGDRNLGLVPLLRLETIRQEIGVKDEQTKSIETTTLQIREEFGGQMQELLQSFRDLSPEERRARRDENDGRIAEMRGKINERLRGALDENQFKRLNEIEVQRQVRTNGIGALTDRDIAAALDLSDDQKNELRRQGGDAQEQREPLSLEDVRAKVKGVLSPEQMGKLDTLFGEAFDLPREMLERGRSRMGGGGRRGGDGEGRRRLRQRPDFEDGTRGASDSPAPAGAPVE